MQIAQSTFPTPGWRQKRLEHEWRFAALRVRIAASRFFKAYDPNQPRAPAGTSIGGQWIAGGTFHIPDEAIGTHDGEDQGTPIRVAQVGPPPRSGTRINVGGQLLEATPAQISRYDAALLRAQIAFDKWRQLDPNARWPTSISSRTVEGAIARRIGEADEIEARLRAAIPAGYLDQNVYTRHGQVARDWIHEKGHTDARVMIRGSSVTRSYWDDPRPFTTPNDHDLAIISPTLVRAAQRLGMRLAAGPHPNRSDPEKDAPRSRIVRTARAGSLNCLRHWEPMRSAGRVCRTPKSHR